MLEFKRVSDISDIHIIEKYVKGLESHFSTLNLPGFMLWRNLYPREYCIYNDTLILREFNPDEENKAHFFMPMGPDIEGAVTQIENHCKKNCERLVFANLMEPEAKELSKKYFMTDIYYDRCWSDYIYLAKDLREFAGKKFSGQRNHINKFKKNYGEPVYNEINGKNKNRVMEFLERFGRERDFSSPTEKEEFIRVIELLENMDEFDMFGGFIEAQGTIVAMSMGEVRDDMLHVTVEKADRSFEGAYQVMVQEFARHHTDDNIIYINREDDMGLEGLRTSKLQYKPIEIKHKYYMYAKTLFDKIKPVSDIEGKRISLTDIEDSDAENFFTLSSDTENNKYWGYDYREDAQYKESPIYFMNFVKRMKDTKEEYSLAIRYNGNLAGEVVFHNMDVFGGVEIGIRLMSKYQGLGLGTEATQLASDYARKIGAKKISMKCFKVNTASCNMIEKAGFRKTHTSDTHVYFEL